MHSCFGRKICQKSFLAIHNAILDSLYSIVFKARWTHQAPHKSAGHVAVNVLSS